MKKIISLFILTILIIFIINASKVDAQDEIIKNSESAIVVEVDNGTVLYEYHADERRAPASTTKLMSIKLFMDAIKKGKLTYDQVLTTSEYASSMGGSQIYLAPKEKMTVRDLLQAVIIASANDATVVLAEAVAGTESKFVELMNKEAQTLGLKNTNFVNCTGLHEENHHTNARELAIIATTLLKSYCEDILPISSTYETYLRKNTEKPFWLVNTNKLIKQGYGIDGLKTGWTNQAGYCLVSTKEVNNMRVISVVMGAATSKGRNADTIALLNYVFNNFDKQLISSKGDIVLTNYDFLYTPSNYNIVLSEDVSRVIPKGENVGIVTYKVELDDTKIKNNIIKNVGIIKIYVDGKLYKMINLDLEEKLKKKSFFELFVEIYEGIF